MLKLASTGTISALGTETSTSVSPSGFDRQRLVAGGDDEADRLPLGPGLEP